MSSPPQLDKILAKRKFGSRSRLFWLGLLLLTTSLPLGFVGYVQLQYKRILAANLNPPKSYFAKSPGLSRSKNQAALLLDEFVKVRRVTKDQWNRTQRYFLNEILQREISHFEQAQYLMNPERLAQDPSNKAPLTLQRRQKLNSGSHSNEHHSARSELLRAYDFSKIFTSQECNWNNLSVSFKDWSDGITRVGILTETDLAQGLCDMIQLKMCSLVAKNSSTQMDEAIVLTRIFNCLAETRSYYSQSLCVWIFETQLHFLEFMLSQRQFSTADLRQLEQCLADSCFNDFAAMHQATINRQILRFLKEQRSVLLSKYEGIRDITSIGLYHKWTVVFNFEVLKGSLRSRSQRCYVRVTASNFEAVVIAASETISQTFIAVDPEINSKLRRLVEDSLRQIFGRSLDQYRAHSKLLCLRLLVGCYQHHKEHGDWPDRLEVLAVYKVIQTEQRTRNNLPMPEFEMLKFGQRLVIRCKNSKDFWLSGFDPTKPIQFPVKKFAELTLAKQR